MVDVGVKKGDAQYYKNGMNYMKRVHFAILDGELNNWISSTEFKVL